MTRFYGLPVVLLVLVLLFVAICPISANAAYRPIDSDLDPEILRMDESEFLGVKLGDRFEFVDDYGSLFTMRDLRGKSRILLLSYFTCDGACPAINMELGDLLKEVEKLGRVKIGKDYEVLTVSFDKNDDATSGKHFREMLNLPEEMEKHWTIATFRKPEEIKQLTSKIGYRFFWSPADRMFYHPNAFVFLSPEGRIVRVMHNLKISARDMELALIDTNFNRLQPSEIVAMAISFCYSYNYKEGKYGLNYPLFFAVGSLFLGVGAFSYGALIIRKRGKVKEMTT